MFSKLQQYKVTNTPYTSFSQPISIDEIPYEENMVRNHSGCRKKKQYDLSNLRDEKFTTKISQAIDNLVELFPDYEVFMCKRKAENYNSATGNKANVFRFMGSRNDEKKQIFVFIHFRYESSRIIEEQETQKLFDAPRTPARVLLRPSPTPVLETPKLQLHAAHVTQEEEEEVLIYAE